MITLEAPPALPPHGAYPPDPGFARIRLNHLSPECVRDARSFIAAHCHGCDVPERVCDSAVMCVSELASNCVRHVVWPSGRDCFGVSFRYIWPLRLLVVQVTDPDPWLPVWGRVDPAVCGTADANALDEGVCFGGWGLSNVETIAEELLFWRTRFGKCGRFSMGVV